MKRIEAKKSTASILPESVSIVLLFDGIQIYLCWLLLRKQLTRQGVDAPPSIHGQEVVPGGKLPESGCREQHRLEPTLCH